MDTAIISKPMRMAGRFVPANGLQHTWLKRVGIAAPHPMIVQMRDGRLVFGSRRIAGVADDVTTANYLLSATLSNAGHQVIGLSQVFSSIYAFDLFIFNDDRHFGNYLSLDDNGVRRFYAFDFSRALFWKWPWVGIPEPDQNTRLCATSSMPCLPSGSRTRCGRRSWDGGVATPAPTG
jgi:hypothetical protein